MSPKHEEIRSYLIEELNKDLIGPRKLDEELTDPPTVHYLAGILFPENTKVDVEQDEDANQASSEDEDEADVGTLIATSSNPSSIGMTFVVKKGITLIIKIRAATYELEIDTTNQRRIWKRRELEIEPIKFRIDNSKLDNPNVAQGLKVMIRVRERDETAVVTISLINKYKSRSAPDTQNELCFFQPSIEVRADDNEPVFLARQLARTGLQDPDRDLYDLLYRHVPEFAVGHGCSVEWNTLDGENATFIRTSIIPAFEILQISPDLEQGFHAQEMKFLAFANKSDLIKELLALRTAYADWIDEQENKIDGLPKSVRSIAARNLNTCRQVASRIEKGIRLIEKDEVVQEAFQLANRSMLIQRARVVWMKQKSDIRPEVPVLSEEHRWRPFQLAFILMSLSSVADPTDEDRLNVDLLWFPTGGGKTEAYLGLTAFAIFLRRFRHLENGGGVTVLMRYTLRLLTIQQFQRAATLIMACETIRREIPNRLGPDPITLGLWVGGSATPNSLKDAGEALTKLLSGERVLEGNPYQILNCPWCGAKLSPRDYKIAENMTIQCPNDRCDFMSGMPLYLVDDDIYSRRPSLLIGTVDKFARMPWAARVSEIFGRGSKVNLPPELIIQDELHLISGPLGTLVGLYESAIDVLCQRDGIPPKIIASTATIRRAGEQCKSLFNRGLMQFPPPALDARDSFFSKEIPRKVKPGRLYVGIFAPGKSMKTALLRVYAVLLQKIFSHTGAKDLRDPYWTLVGYFNSMRELGGAVRLVEDDVRERIRVLSTRDGEKQRYIESIEELNSRLGSDEIPQRLNAMAAEIGQPDVLDVLLATNMISVGVDVDRLGLMVVTGQPKMSSEYIQATSRIGRKYPGLVVTIYNWTRPRDRSHYERFVGYHSAIYSKVEPTSVTPFASRARDRGLHGIFISLVRHLLKGMAPEDAAVAFSPTHPDVQKIKDLILERVEAIDPTEVNDTREELELICRRWDVLCQAGTLYYGPSMSNPDLPHLMHQAEANIMDSLSLATLNSLRDVEGQSGLFPMSGGN